MEKMNKKGELLMENVVFIIITILFFAMIFLFLSNKSNDVSLTEEVSAKKIALLIDSAESDSKILVDVNDVFKNSKISEPVYIDNFNNVVRVKMSDKTGYVYSYFNDINVDSSFTEIEGRKYLVLVVDLAVSPVTNLDEVKKNFEFSLNSEQSIPLNSPLEFSLENGEVHHITLISLDDNSARLFIESDPIEINLNVGQSVKLDFDNDGYYDQKITLVKIDKEKSLAYITRENIHEIVPNAVFSSSENFPTENLENKNNFKENQANDWVNKLPSREELPKTSYSCGVDACGPSALYDSFHALGNEVNPSELDAKRLSGFRGTFTKFLGLFNGEARQITWPGQIVDIAEEYGYNVEVLTGEKANLQTIRERSTQNSAVIVQESLDKDNPLFTQHYEYYDTNYIKEIFEKGYDYPGKDKGADPIVGEDVLIRRVFVISKNI